MGAWLTAQTGSTEGCGSALVGTPGYLCLYPLSLHWGALPLAEASVRVPDLTLLLLLHCTGVFLCFWGVLTRLD
jgi:hypothetical protein